MNWQPIETAPKDGTCVLIYCVESGAAQVTEANFEGGRWSPVWFDCHGCGCCGGGGGGDPHPLDAPTGAAQVTRIHNTWRSIPSGIPRTKELREAKLQRVWEDRWRPFTPENDAEDAARIARQVAKDLGREGLFQG